MKKRIVGGLLAIAMVFGLVACHGGGHYTSDKTYAAVSVATGIFDGESAYVDVTVRNDHTSEIGVEFDVEDGVNRANPRYVVPAGQTYETVRVGGYEQTPINTGNPGGVDVYVRIFNTFNNATIEWHVFENITGFDQGQ